MSLDAVGRMSAVGIRDRLYPAPKHAVRLADEDFLSFKRRLAG